MRVRFMSALLTVVAPVCVVAIAASAYAATQVTLGLTASPSKGTYGTEVAIQPSLSATAYPGDKVDIQAWDSEAGWEKWGEGLAVEETIAPDAGSAVLEPMHIFIDESLVYPAVLRGVYLPKGSQYTTAASDPVVISLTRNTKTATKIIVPAKVKRGTSFAIGTQVVSNCGIGKVQVTVKKVGSSRIIRKAVLITNEEGLAEGSFKLSSAGRYSVKTKFLGNTFGVASPTASKTITVR